MPVSRSIIEKMPSPFATSWNDLHALAGIVVIGLATACGAPSETASLESAFVARNTIEIIKELDPEAPVVATLKLGAQVGIVARRRRFVKLRTESGVEGWTQESKLITPEVRELMEQLREQTRQDPAQGRLHAFSTLNVHLDPHRWSPTLYQLQADEGAEMLRHRLIERLPHEPRPGRPAPAPTGLDDWYLVRTAGGQPGWVLTTGVYSGIPDEVKQYAERRRISAYLPLDEVETRSGEKKTTWFWAQAGRPKQPHDFSIIRVFQWSRRANAYQTLRVERGLTGYLPVEFLPKVEAKRGSGPGFRFVVAHKGKRLRRTYLLLKSRVYLIEQEPAGPAREQLRLVREAKKPPAPPPSLVDRLIHRWREWMG